MMLLAVGCNFRDTPIALRERLAFDDDKLLLALDQINTRFGWEAVILSTCNRVEVYVARPDGPAPPDRELVAEFLGEVHRVPIAEFGDHLYEHRDAAAVRHIFRVAASLDSMIVGEGQIAGQVKRAYELAHERGTAGRVLHPLFQHAHYVAKRVRSDTGIARGHVSVPSVAVDYVRQVFAHFDDKTVLVIGAGKMGELTLRHLRRLQPRRIFVTNRSFDKAESIAKACGGAAASWDQLDDLLVKADIVLSTTGASEPIITKARYERIQARRSRGTVVILDIAVPRDFDPAIHDGDQTCVFNIDDLRRIRDQTLQSRLKHVTPAEAIVEQEQRRFLKNWNRRSHGPVIARLMEEFEAKLQAIVKPLLDHFNGRLTEEERTLIEGAFRRYQNQLLHGPISALTEEPHEAGGHTLLEALRKLFRLQE